MIKLQRVISVFLEKILYFCVLIVLKELAKIKSYNNLL